MADRCSCSECLALAAAEAPAAPASLEPEWFPRSPLGRTDAGSTPRTDPAAMCLARVDGDDGGWCQGHEGKYRGVGSGKALPVNLLNKGRRAAT